MTIRLSITHYLSLIISLLIPPLFSEDFSQAELINRLEGFAKRHIEEFQKSLPKGYSFRPLLTQKWSDDEQKILGILLALTPLDSKGRPNGEEKHFDSYQVSKTIPYVKGAKHGLEKRYLTGRNAPRKGIIVTAEIPWEHGKIIGTKKLFHDNGRLRLEIVFKAEGREGKSQEFDLNGRLVKSTHYKGGERHGLVTEYWSLTGKPRRIVEYRNGDLQGVVREFYDSGVLKKEVQVKDGEFHGVEKQFDEEGGLSKKKYWWKDDVVSAGGFKRLKSGN
jgi:antitoxin component YwqK of YwqJK toxin-antitoxin module